MNLLSTEVDVCTLSHIFSFLRYENIYRLSRVSQSWNHTISEGYFFSEVFDADQVLHELNDGWARLKQFYSKIIPVPYDRKKQAIEALEEQMLQREIMARLNNLSNLLAYMKRRHGTVKCVKEFRLFEVSLLKLGAETVVLDGIGALFPNIEVVRASFDFYNTVPVYTDSLLEELSQMENLNRIYIVCSNIEEHLEIYDQIICALNQRFKVYTVNMCESLWQRKFDLGFENDYELCCLLEKHDWLLGVHVGQDNILRRAIAANFTKSIKYILEKAPDSLWKWSSFSQTSNPLMYVMNVENKLFSKVVRQVTKLREKSDDYLNETLSKGFYNIMDPISSLLAYSKEFPPLDQQKLTYTLTLLKINTVDRRLLKIQTGMSFIQYLIMNNSLTDYPFIWDFVVDEDISDVYSFFNNNSLLHDMMTSNMSFEQFKKILGRFYKDETVFLKHLMHVNYGGQTVAHYLLSDLKYENWKFSQLTLEKYQFMKERGGKDFLKLLFLENQSSVTPIELMLKCSQDHSLTDTCHLIELLVSDMLECDREQTISIVNRMCTEKRHFNLYFLVCRVIETWGQSKKWQLGTLTKIQTNPFTSFSMKRHSILLFKVFYG